MTRNFLISVGNVKSEIFIRVFIRKKKYQRVQISIDVE